MLKFLLLIFKAELFEDHVVILVNRTPSLLFYFGDAKVSFVDFQSGALSIANPRFELLGDGFSIFDCSSSF